MVFKELEIQGFKSFPDKVKIRFDEGVTGVVGPNGSGKSNLSDAGRWVLGETSSRQLRAAGKMEDVIFGGTRRRGAMGFAMVRLTLDNSAHTLDIDADEAVIGRKYYRSGESEYTINGQLCRLKDIYELLLDTGIGRDGYSVIGQGRIAEIVAAKSSERREIFEEACGIAKYRYRKNEAERRLAAAAENLERLRDILDELEARVGPLEKESEKAQRFLELSARRKTLEVTLWTDGVHRAREAVRRQVRDYETAQAEYERFDREARAAEAEAETQQQLNCYADVCEQDLAIPVVKGRKTDKEKFAGAEATYTIEAMMKDGKALQSGTSHYFGDKFSKAYDVTFTGRDNQLHHPFQTSWGVSTRLVGAIIMTHGDDDGLILPPAVAPIQVVVVPIAAHKPGVSEKAAELAEKISKYARVKLDDSDNAPGWKFSQWEMKGVPLRLEIGPKDLEKNQCVLVRRDTREKVFVSLDELETAIPAQLEALRKDLYERALANREKRTWAATTMDEVKELAKANTGYIKTMWCGDLACEMKMKEEVGLSSRCMPFEQEHLSDVCPCCGKPASKMVYWGVAY